MVLIFNRRGEKKLCLEAMRSLGSSREPGNVETFPGSTEKIGFSVFVTSVKVFVVSSCHLNLHFLLQIMDSIFSFAYQSFGCTLGRCLFMEYASSTNGLP